MARRIVGAGGRAEGGACCPFSARCLLETKTLIGRKSGRRISVAYRLFDRADASCCADMLRANYLGIGPRGCGIIGTGAESDFESFISEYSRDRLSIIARKRNYRVVELGCGTLAGVAGFMPSGLEVMVVDVSVAPPLQGEGIGTFLMACLVGELRSLPLARFAYLEASRGAIGFYEKAGFRAATAGHGTYSNGEHPVHMGMPL